MKKSIRDKREKTTQRGEDTRDKEKTSLILLGNAKSLEIGKTVFTWDFEGA